MKLTIVIPVLNEESTLQRQIELLNLYLEHNQDVFTETEVIIADNGSSDSTQDIGIRISNDFKNIRYCRTPVPGVGSALKYAWTNSSSEIIGYMDLDLATNLNHLKEVINIFAEKQVDLVNGSRLLDQSVVIGRSKIRTFTSKTFNLLVKLVFGVKFSDGMCGFKFLRRDQLEKIISNGATSNDWFFSTELLVVGEKLNLNIVEIPVVWTDDNNSKVKIISLSTKYIKSIFELNRRIGK